MSRTHDDYGILLDLRGFPVRQPTEDEVVLRAARIAHPVFVAEGWVYGGTWTVPTEDELADTIRGLLRSLREDVESVEVGSGRFNVTLTHDGSIEVCLELGCIPQSEGYDPTPSRIAQ